MGLMLAEPGYHTRAFVEWEEYPRECLIAAQRAGNLAPAPIWDNVKTFDARPYAGAIDTITAGYPCQPFSMAGQRRGEDDPRHLWPDVARIIRELGDGLRWVFLENVPGHITLGAETVLRAIWDMGFTPAVGIFSAREVGAPHERQRWFCVAHRAGNVDDTRPSWGRPSIAAWHVSDRQAPGWIEGPDRPEQSGGAMDHITSARCNAARIWAEADSKGGERLPGNGRNDMADASSAGLQRREQPGSPDQWDGQAAHGPVAECGSPRIFPPGPGDAAAWGAIMAADPSRAPAIARSDAKAAALNLAALFNTDAAQAIEQQARGISSGSELAALVGQAGALVDQAQALARFRDVVDGMANRTRALRLLGNGVVPLAAAHAWRTLAAAHSLGRVDLDAACRSPADAANGNV